MPGVTAYPSDANFVLFVPPAARRRRGLAGLLDRGVLIRDLTAVVPRTRCASPPAPQHEVDLFLDSLSRRSSQ